VRWAVIYLDAVIDQSEVGNKEMLVQLQAGETVRFPLSIEGVEGMFVEAIPTGQEIRLICQT
jgi:hypothetical protein